MPPPPTQQRSQPSPGSDGSPDLTELEREQTQAEIRRILTETDLFVKFGLNERAAEHVRKVFSLKPDHTGAHERLIAVLAQLGRKAEAIEELGILADRLLETDRAGAERHLRRALELDPHAAGARRMLDRLEGEGSVEKAVPDLEESQESMSSSCRRRRRTRMERWPCGPPMEATFRARGSPSNRSRHARRRGRRPPSGKISVIRPATTGSKRSPRGPRPKRRPAATSRFPAWTCVWAGRHRPRRLPARPTPPPVRPQHAPDKPDVAENHLGASFDEFEIDLEAATPVPEAPSAPPPAAGPPASRPQRGCGARPGGLFPRPGARRRGPRLARRDQSGSRQPSRGVGPPPTSERHTDPHARTGQLSCGPCAAVAHSWDPGAIEGAVPGGPFVEMSGDARGEPTHITPRAVVPAGDPDSTTQRDLGIAYKEMGLFDAAVAEFSKLVDDPEHEVFALTMMGECFESRGTPSEAMIHYKRALNRPQVRDEEATQLYYQLGRVFHTLGDESEALYFFEKVARRSPKHEDVAQRIAALRAQGVAPIPSAAGGSAEERPRFDAARGSTGNRR